MDLRKSFKSRVLVSVCVIKIGQGFFQCYTWAAGTRLVCNSYTINVHYCFWTYFCLGQGSSLWVQDTPGSRQNKEWLKSRNDWRRCLCKGHGMRGMKLKRQRSRSISVNPQSSEKDRSQDLPCQHLSILIPEQTWCRYSVLSFPRSQDTKCLYKEATCVSNFVHLPLILIALMKSKTDNLTL